MAICKMVAKHAILSHKMYKSHWTMGLDEEADGLGCPNRGREKPKNAYVFPLFLA